jgi:hypothetical protein
MALGAAPDPALIIALKEIPDHCGTPLTVQLIQLDRIVAPAHAASSSSDAARDYCGVAVYVLLLTHGVR